VAAARRRAAVALPDGLAQHAGRLGNLVSQWALAEVAPRRLLPWVPVAFGFGIVLYFTADRELALWAVHPVAVGAIAVVFLTRASAASFPLALGFAAIAAGFAIATAQTARIAHPVLQNTVASAAISGFVEIRVERERSDRIVARVQSLDGGRLKETPDRVRVAVRKGSAPAVGDFANFKAHLSPPLSPLRPGGYDFARDMYFQQIRASGYALGKITTAPAPVARGLWLRYAAFVDAIRETIDDRIRAQLPGDQGSIASALNYRQARRHLGAGQRRDVCLKPGACAVDLRLSHGGGGGHRLLLHPRRTRFGAVARDPPADQEVGRSRRARRGVLLSAAVGRGSGDAALVHHDRHRAGRRDGRRPAITFRTLTGAALCVMALAPQAVVHPSFQISFAATLALIAGCQLKLPWRADRDTPLGARVALWGRARDRRVERFTDWLNREGFRWGANCDS
jgi:competence protein ComEC